eukprot:TRINITY_DN64554_c0_g1_i1.p1 TRINITY_DN64554_c0_g1~~TRINITY_DN64554_c0_g1_i1.p1  ORF type:complete len:505 (-),score=112.81 TRINITY_DN64554_c0_g1_i1:249-1763(-)
MRQRALACALVGLVLAAVLICAYQVAPAFKWPDEGAVSGFLQAATPAVGAAASSNTAASTTPATLCIVISGLGGVQTATGSALMAYGSAKHRIRPLSATSLRLFGFGCLLLNISGILFALLASNLGGAVATVMPVQAAAMLFTSMCWQICLNLKRYTKAMQVGTFIMLFAVLELAQIGPTEPDDLDVVTLFREPLAVFWWFVMAVATVVALIGSYATYSQPLHSYAKLTCFTMVVTQTTVIGTSVGKCWSYTTGWVRLAVGVTYFLDGVVCLGFTILASSACDVSLYVPAQLSSQLAINMFTGYFVWGDAKYIDRPVPYIMVYIICLLAVYLIGEDIDFWAEAVRSKAIKNTKLSDARAVSPFGQAVLRLLETWRKRPEPGASREATSATAAAALQEAFQLGVETGSLTKQELVDLVLLLMRDGDYKPNATLVFWIQEHVKSFERYVSHDSDFRDHFRDLLGEDEKEKLSVMESASRSASSHEISMTQPSSGRPRDPLLENAHG